MKNLIISNCFPSHLLNLVIMCNALRLLQTCMCVWGDRPSSLPLCEAQLCCWGDISPLSSEAASVLWHHCDVSACHTGALKLAWIGGFGLSVLSPNLFLFIYLSSLLVFFLYACFSPVVFPLRIHSCSLLILNCVLEKIRLYFNGFSHFRFLTIL